MVRVVALAIVLALGAVVHAQPVAVKEIRRLAPPLDCDRLTIKEGLPNANVRAVVQDPRGLLWFGTQDGLVRYDGISMHVYRPGADPRTLSSGFITALAVDGSGKLWVGTAEHGVNLYDPDTDRFTRYSSAAGNLGAKGVTAITRDARDQMWFALAEGGVSRFANGSFEVHREAPLDAGITAIDADATGTLWLGTSDGALLSWTPGKGPAQRVDVAALTEGAPVLSIFAATSGTVWAGTDGKGLIELAPNSGKPVAHVSRPTDYATLTDDHVSVLFEDKRGALWIGTPKGLNRRDPTGRIVRYQHDSNDPTSLAFPAVESIFQDAAGVMWIGGLSVGLCKFDEARFRFARHRTLTSANAFHEDADGTLWVGTFNDGVYKYERSAQRVTLYTSLGKPGEPGYVPLESAWISMLLRDRKGTLWIGVKGEGLVAFDSKADTWVHHPAAPDEPGKLPVDTVFGAWEDAAGRLWLATWGGGLVRRDPDGTHHAFTAASGHLTSDHLYAVYPDPSEAGALWIGTAQGGLVKFDTKADRSIATFRHKADAPDSLSSDDVTSIYRDAAGIVWVGTYGGGLDRIDPATSKVKRYTTRDTPGFTNDTIYGVLPDETGHLWLSTNGGGLLHFDPKTERATAYETTDGLQDNEFTQGGVYRSAKSGELFFGGPSGFNAFFAKQIGRDKFVPPIVLTAFKLFNRTVALDVPIWKLPPVEVSYSDSFEVHFAALSYAAPGRNRYAYKLEGFDDKFIETSHPFATYTKLDGGNYVLRVRAANHHGVWNEEAIALSIAVSPPFWRSWIAYAIYAVVGIAILALVIRLQRQRVRRVQREARLSIVEHDLQLTGAVQSGFLPEGNVIRTGSFDLVGFYRPADACGGDWWWHEQLPEGRHVILVGDVTGHGPGPAMVTAAVATAFRVLVENGFVDVRQTLDVLNREVWRVAKGKYHMTIATIVIDESTGKWTLYNAGAPPIMSLDTSGKHRIHFAPGNPLGVTSSDFVAGVVTGTLAPNERMMLYTDGIPEIMLGNETVLGMRKFGQLYEKTRARPVNEAVATIVQHAVEAQGNRAQADDWTFTILEWRS